MRSANWASINLVDGTKRLAWEGLWGKQRQVSALGVVRVEGNRKPRAKKERKATQKPGKVPGW